MLGTVLAVGCSKEQSSCSDGMHVLAERQTRNKEVYNVKEGSAMKTKQHKVTESRGRAIVQSTSPGTASLIREQRPEGKAGTSLE